MKHGFIRVGAATPEIRIADCGYNADRIIALTKEAESVECDILVFPELSVTGYSCGDLFSQSLLVKSALTELLRIAEETRNENLYLIVGAPFCWHANLYNCAFVLGRGKIAGIVPKSNIPNYGEFYEGRYFKSYTGTPTSVMVNGAEVPFGNLIFDGSAYADGFLFGVEICEDLWVADRPSSALAQNGALILCNLSASNEVIGKREYRRTLISAQSGTTVSAYIYSDAGWNESTSDLIFSGHKMIAENGKIAVDSGMFGMDSVYYDIDVKLLLHERLKMNTFQCTEQENYRKIPIPICLREHAGNLIRTFARTPFVPADPACREERCRAILDMQAYALRRRLLHTKAQYAVLGISGGLDSTLALISTVRAFDLAGLPRENVISVTMPCFGTTDRTYRNATELCRAFGTSLREINIEKAVRQHFTDIGQDINRHDVTYENAQARERTQILMDIANQVGGLVIGTGDLSELALGWATYNGDHMSMYGLNASIPKTLIRYLVSYYANTVQEPLRLILQDVLDTPVSPELLPPENGSISQKTEDIVGPYELHDFFLYYFLRCGYEPEKLLKIAISAFDGAYAPEIVQKWLRIFLSRFFSQQFKRSCLPDGPKVGTVALSPRGDLRMPSDASSALWLAQIPNP